LGAENYMANIITSKNNMKKVNNIKARMPLSVCAVAITAMICVIPVQAQSKKSNLDIDAQVMETALNQLAQAYGKQIVVYSDDAKGLSSERLVGVFTEDEALNMLLKNSDLTYKYINDRTIAVGSAERLAAKDDQPKEVSSFLVAQVAQESDKEIETTGFEGPGNQNIETTTVLPTLEQLNPNDDVIVTGTRFTNPNLTAPNPVTSISSVDIRNSGRTRITDVLQRLPALKQSEQSDDFDDGRQNLDLRHLGAARTLTLVDGKRFVPGSAGNSAVDVSAIPIALLERIDVLTGGASAIYGADAVTGVVNFILKDDFEGASISGRYGAAIDQWDADDASINLLLGKNFDSGRGNITASYSFSNIDQLLSSDRDFSSPEERIVFRNNVTGMSPELVPVLGDFSNFSRDGAEILPSSFFTGPGQSLNGDGTFFTEADQSLTAEVFGLQLRPQSQTHNASLSGHYNISEAFRPYFRGIYSNTNNESRTLPGQFTFGQPIAIDNPFLPQQAIDAFSPFPPFVTSPTFNRLDNDRPITTFTDPEVFQITGGIKGDINDHLRYDIYGNIGRNDVTIRSSQIQRDRYIAAIDAVEVGGNIVCRDVSVFADCAPLNPFSRSEAVNGAAYDFIYQPGETVQSIDQNIVSGFIGGDLEPLGLSLPGGAVEFILGAEYREEIFETRVNEFSTTTQTDPQKISVTEVFGEIGLPIFSEAGPLLEELTLTGAFRYSDYNTSGGSSTYNVGGVWAPNTDIKFRGTYARSVRSPNVTELFLAPVFFSPLLTGDPCDDQSVNNGSQFRVANCATVLTAAGADPATYDFDNFTFGGGFLPIAGQTSGNPNLTPERADTFTLGAVLTPDFIEGLSLTVDYYDISINSAIGNVNEGFILEQCVDAPTIDNQFCDLITRGPNGAPSFLLTTPVNIGEFETSGFEIAANYNFPETEVGLFQTSVTANYLNKLSAQTTSDPASAIDERGIEGTDTSFFRGLSPTWTVNFDLNWAKDKWDSNFGINYHNSVLRVPNVERDRATEVLEDPNLDALWNLRYQLGYSVDENARFYIGFDNLLDQKPDVGTNFQPADPVGRFLYFGFQLDI